VKSQVQSEISISDGIALDCSPLAYAVCEGSDVLAMFVGEADARDYALKLQANHGLNVRLFRVVVKSQPGAARG
jgi:hypothetical protein